MSWKQLLFAGSLVIGFGIACSGGDDFETPEGSGGSDAGTGKKADGAECEAADECGSGFCADGVCCDTACDGDCVACVIPGKEGVCTPMAGGTKDTCGDGPCGGACDGEGACVYPDATHECGGAKSCKDGVQTGDFCDGQGECKATTIECGNYVCEAGACRTSCSPGGGCAPDAHCEDGKCVGKSSNGGSCSAPTDCESGECVDGVCCDVACDAPASCSTGTCTCGDVACEAGEACITWYADTDNDGFGDPDAAKVGCAGTAPTGGKYVTNSDDCYDKNISAKPGQVAYFPVHRGDGSFDYDCSGATEKQYQNVSGQSCGNCGAKIGSGCSACWMAFGCTMDNCTQQRPKEGFKTDLPCGASGTLYSCAGISSCSNTAQTQTTAQQSCR